jgi:hypothetical protein
MKQFSPTLALIVVLVACGTSATPDSRSTMEASTQAAQTAEMREIPIPEVQASMEVGSMATEAVGPGGAEPIHPGSESPNSAARQWIEAVWRLDGLAAEKRTCVAMLAQLEEEGLWASAVSVIGQSLTGQVVQVDLSGLSFRTVEEEDNSARVRVTGEIRTAVLLSVERSSMDQIWLMSRENGLWKWCGSMSASGATATVKVESPGFGATATAAATATTGALMQAVDAAAAEAYEAAESAAEEGDWVQATLLYRSAYDISRRYGDVAAKLQGAIAHSGRLLVSQAGRLTSIAVDGSRAEPQWALPEGCAGCGLTMRWSRDASRIVYQDGRQVWLMDSDGDNRSTLPVLKNPDDIAWSPDGQHLIYAEDYRLGLLDIETGVASLLGGCAQNYDARVVDWSRSGDRIVFWDWRDHTIVTASPNGMDCVTLADHIYGVRLLSWSPDGESVLIAEDGTLLELSVASGALEEIGQLYADWVGMGTLVWSPGGDYVAASSGEGTSITLVNLSTYDIQRLAAVVDYGSALAWFSW